MMFSRASFAAGSQSTWLNACNDNDDSTKEAGGTPYAIDRTLALAWM